jgi:hypothetical protein
VAPAREHLRRRPSRPSASSPPVLARRRLDLCGRPVAWRAGEVAPRRGGEDCAAKRRRARGSVADGHWLGAVESSAAGQQDDGPSRRRWRVSSSADWSPWSAAGCRPCTPPRRLLRQPTARSRASSPSLPLVGGTRGHRGGRVGVGARRLALGLALGVAVRFMCWRPGAP